MRPEHESLIFSIALLWIVGIGFARLLGLRGLERRIIRLPLRLAEAVIRLAFRIAREALHFLWTRIARPLLFWIGRLLWLPIRALGRAIR